MFNPSILEKSNIFSAVSQVRVYIAVLSCLLYAWQFVYGSSYVLVMRLSVLQQFVARTSTTQSLLDSANMQVLQHDPDNAKGLFRRGKARHALGHTDEALKDLEAAANK